MRDVWAPDELISAWTLVEGDWELIGNKTGVTRLGFSLILKFNQIEGRFPAYPEEVPRAAVEYVASLVKVDPALLAKYSWRERRCESGVGGASVTGRLAVTFDLQLGPRGQGSRREGRMHRLE